MSEKLTYSEFKSRYSYKDKKHLGSGGFGKVYKVFDTTKNCYVALKISDVRPESEKFTLQREVELVNKLLKNKNIATYDDCYRFDVDFQGPTDYAILKFYEDGNLEEFLSKKQVSLEDKKLIIQGILEGLAFLHKNDIIHRDLKPQNILLSREDGIWVPKIADFGLSRQSGGNAILTNSAIGYTTSYAAPEQIENQKINKNVDLWAVGVVIYRMIAGELPFQGRKGGNQQSSDVRAEIMRKIKEVELPEKLETLNDPYRTIIQKCLVLADVRVKSAVDLIQILNREKMPDKDGSVDPVPVSPFKDDIPGGGESPNNRLPEDNPIPNENETVPVPESKKNEPTPPYKDEPRTRESRRDFKVLRALLLILLMGVIVGLFFYLRKQHELPNTPDEIKILPVPKQTQGNNRRGNGINKDFREVYQKLLNIRISGTNHDKSFDLLMEAAEIAIKNKESKALLNDINSDKYGALQKLSHGHSNVWNAIIDALKYKDVTKLKKHHHE